MKTLAVFPICVGGAPVGVIYFFLGDEHGQLDEEATSLMSRLAENVSFGLEMFKREEARHSALKEQDNLHRMYVALSATNEAIMRSTTRDELFKLVCSAAVLGGKFTSTTIALAEPGEDFLRIAATKGENAERVQSTRFAISADRPEGRGSTGTSFRTKRPCIINDYLTDERTKHWRTLAGEGGTKSGASFPLLKGRDAVGVLLFLSSEKDTFTEELVDLLARLAENISFALENFDRNAEKRQADEQIQYLATHDALTGLPNRAMFNELLDFSIKSARRNGRKCAVLFIDLDRFKIINDTLGHAAGDALLVEVGHRLRSSVRESDVVVRLGGDEFIIILNEISDRDQAALTARKVLSVVSPGIILAGHEGYTTASIGIAMFPADGVDVETLTKNADMAMYLAKENGKNNFRFFEPEMDASIAAHNKLGQELRHALATDEFEVHYQPIVSIETRGTVGMEALVRWRHPLHGLMSPDTFIPLAEETGLIVPLGAWVLREACIQTQKWRTNYPKLFKDFLLSVNVSARQLFGTQLQNDVVAALNESGLDPRHLVLEIVESQVMTDVHAALRQFAALKEIGVRIAIDDFGTGYSSLGYLQDLPVDFLKLDKSFTDNIAESVKSQELMRTVAQLSRALSIATVAEGVETLEQADVLNTLDVNLCQGFYFARPIDAASLSRMLKRVRHLPEAVPAARGLARAAGGRRINVPVPNLLARVAAPHLSN